jgi:hypothetical protein
MRSVLGILLTPHAAIRVPNLSRSFAATYEFDSKKFTKNRRVLCDRIPYFTGKPAQGDGKKGWGGRF